MKNKDWMDAISKIRSNHKQKQGLVIFGVLLIIAGGTAFYIHQNSKKKDTTISILQDQINQMNEWLTKQTENNKKLLDVIDFKNKEIEETKREIAKTKDDIKNSKS